MISQFWNDVRGRLIGHHHKKPNVADSGIQRLRADADRLGFSGAVYNGGSDHTADNIAGWLDADTWPQYPS